MFTCCCSALSCVLCHLFSACRCCSKLLFIGKGAAAASAAASPWAIANPVTSLLTGQPEGVREPERARE